jgi:hypothetical protein
MAAFYRVWWGDKVVSRVEALRQAQLTMLKESVGGLAKKALRRLALKDRPHTRSDPLHARPAPDPVCPRRSRPWRAMCSRRMMARRWPAPSFPVHGPHESHRRSKGVPPGPGRAVRFFALAKEGAIMNTLTKWALGLLLFAFTPPLWAQPDLEGTIYGFYQEYLRRSPAQSEVRAWAGQVQAGAMSLPDVQANILGSQEYFDLHRRDPRRFIGGLYLDVLRRRAAAGEVEAWLSNYNAANGDTAQVARQFLTAAQHELALQRWTDGDQGWSARRDRDRRFWSRRYSGHWWKHRR